MIKRTFCRTLACVGFLMLMNQSPLAFGEEITSIATGGYANQLRTPEMMQKIDANGDHMVSRGEWDTYQERLFTMMDADKSGALEQAEIKGSASKDLVSFATGGFASALRSPDMWTRLDADHDGTVSREEFLGYQGKVFGMMDTAKTGMLDKTAFFGRGSANH